jgi:hypothetical protein
MTGIESSTLKLVWARDHIDAIRDISWDYCESEPNVIIKHPDGSHELKFVVRPPDTISVLAGEAIYQIRSALDHLAFQLVELNRGGVTLPLDWGEKCAFPLRVKSPKKPPEFNCFEGTLPGITEQAFTFIESVQPYNRSDVGVSLGRLGILSNIDKHRHLHLTKPQAHRRDEATIRYKGMVMNTSSIIRVEEGTRTKGDFDFPDTEVLNVQVGGAFTPFVSFDEPALDPGVLAFPVADLLQTCLERVQRIIVPALEKFINSP